MAEHVTGITLAIQISEVEREIKMRRQVYDGLVARGKMTNAKADRGIRVMESVLDTLRSLQGTSQGALLETLRSSIHEEPSE